MPVYEIELKYYPTVLYTNKNTTQRYLEALEILSNEDLQDYELMLLRDVKSQHPFYDLY